MDFNYKSPINKIEQEIASQIVETEEGKLMYEVQKAIGYSIEKEELIKALQYDRGQYEKGYKDGYNANKWIPVSERLPKVMDGTNGECSDNVLMCVADDEWITISTGFYGYYPGDITLQGWWSVWADGCCQLDSKYKVIAWLPLPKPYKAETEDKK